MMWLPLIIYLSVKITIISSIIIDSTVKNEPVELIDLFIENLKADPLLLGEQKVSAKSKLFINNKIEKFVHLVSQRQNAKLSRVRRSVEDKGTIEAKGPSMSIASKNIIPTQYAEDIRLFRQDVNWFVVSLEDTNALLIYQYSNGSFRQILQKKVHYTTNVAVLSTNPLPLIVVGEAEINRFKVFQFNFKKTELELIQTIKVHSPKHVALWEQDHQAYLAITEVQDHSGTTQAAGSHIKIYQWLGGHFDHIQDLKLFDIKKTVPFNIHGSNFLAAVKYGNQKDEEKSYSEIFKFNVHSMRLEPYQRLLTNGCTDIKYFTTELHGENHHFLVVVHNARNDSSIESDSSISVIYKYEDQYFIPFQSVITDSVEWQPVQDLKGNAALISVTPSGLKGFQYNGWHFFESTIETNKNDSVVRFEDIQALHTYDFDGEQILVIACGHCKNTPNIYSVHFTDHNAIKDLHSQVLRWCTDTLDDLESNEGPDLFVSESLRGDHTEEISVEEDQKHQISAALKESSQILHNIEDDFRYSLPTNDSHVFENDIETETIIFNDNADVNDLKADSINDISLDSFLDNVLDIEDGFTVDDLMEFNVIVADNALDVRKLNGVFLERFIALNNSDLALNKLIVHGSVTFLNGLNVTNSINNVSVHEDNLILKVGDQTFKQNLIVDEIVINRLRTTHFNDLWGFKNSSQEISHIEHLKVKSLEIGGLLNRVSVPVLAQRALRKRGNQTLQEPLSVDSLIVHNLIVKGELTGKQVPSDFALTHLGEFTVGQDVEFLSPLQVNKLEVLGALNNITVTDDGDLDVLLSDSPYIQLVPAKKTFENLVITRPIRLQNKINNPQIRRFSPLIIDSVDRRLEGDVTINGRVEATKWLKVNNMKPLKGNRSFGDALANGVKLTERQVPVHLEFEQALDLEDVIADRVNSLSPREWMLQTSNSSQIVRGDKRFLGDLYLKGHVNAFRINDVDVRALHKDVLRVEGDQQIDGVWKVDRVITRERLISNKTLFNETGNISDVLLIDNDLIIEHLSTKNLQAKGLINSHDFAQITRNLVKKGASHKIIGQKNFKELHVDDLIVHDNGELLQLLDDIMHNQVTLNTSLDLFNEIGINHLTFNKSLNNISKEDFESLARLKPSPDDTTIVASDVDYDEIVVLGDVFIADEFINSKNLTAIAQDTVKIDEDHEFATAAFGKSVTVHRSVLLEGNIENLDLDSIVEQNSKEPIEMQDKVFLSPVYINGTLYVNTTVNGLDISKFCKFSNPSETLKTLKIEGDVLFAKGPKILNINNLNVKDLKETIWFVDKPANISGNMHSHKTTFNNSVTVMEFVDSINLNLLSKNYLSKTKDQSVTASVRFDNVTFSNISSRVLTTKGPINGYLMDDILKTVLIQGAPQIFESTPYFEEVKVDYINNESDYFVNGLNLKTDVMRYDNQNVVTGQKIFRNLNASSLNLPHNVKIQDVDVLDWLRNAVLTAGTFSIKGKKIINGGTFEQELSLRGKLNYEKFNEETVLLINTPQVVSGKKSFIPTGTEPIGFKILTIKGRVNDVDLEDLVRNQTNRHQDNTLRSNIIFDNNVVVKNINIDVIYDDINVSALIANVSKLRTLESYQDKFENLLDMGMEAERALTDRTSFFKYYMEFMQLTNAYDVFGLNCEDKRFRLVAFYSENGTHVFRTFGWFTAVRNSIFLDATVPLESKPTYMQQVSLGDIDYLYVEHLVDYYENEFYRPVYSGRLLQLVDSTNFRVVAEFQRNATVSLISLVSPGLNELCLGFVDDTLSGIDIYCDEANQDNYYLAQSISMKGVYQATTVQTRDSVYLFLARHELPFKEPSIVVLQGTANCQDFKTIQTIYEGADLNGLTASTIGGVPYVTFSFGSQESTVDSGRISIRRFDATSNKFLQWQHIRVTAPLGVHLVTQTFFEPLVLVPSSDASAPLQIFRYDGAAGFKRILKGSSMSISSKLRIIGKGHFLAVFPENGNVGVILGAVVKGPVWK